MFLVTFIFITLTSGFCKCSILSKIIMSVEKFQVSVKIQTSYWRYVNSTGSDDIAGSVSDAREFIVVI